MYRLFIILLLLTPLSQALELLGDARQGALVIGLVEVGSTITLDGQAVQVADSGRFVLGFDRDAAATAQLTVVLPGGAAQSQQLNVAPRNYRIQRVEGIAKKIMSPSSKALEQIRQESALVRAARKVRLDRQDYAGSFTWPLRGPITGVYGSQRVYNGKPGRPHYGVDVAAPIGTPVSSPAPGLVTLAEEDMFYSGGTLIIDHGHGVSSTLMHLDRVLVRVGDEVVPGDIVAEVGEKGRATGPHLDWRMNWLKARVDPQLLVPLMEPASNK